MAAEDQRVILPPHEHPEFDDAVPPWQHEHDGKVHIHGLEGEAPEPPALDLLVERTSAIFINHDPVANPETGEPYIISSAARQAVEEAVDSGRRPDELLVELAGQTLVPPGVLLAWNDFSSSNGTWPDFFMELSRGIVGEELGRRNPELVEESNKRASNW
jgi:hypothetical protein